MGTLSTKLTIALANYPMKDTSSKLAGPGKFEGPVISVSAPAVWYRGCDSGGAEGSKNESKDEGISKDVDEGVGEEEKIRDCMVVLMVGKRGAWEQTDCRVSPDWSNLYLIFIKVATLLTTIIIMPSNLGRGNFIQIAVPLKHPEDTYCFTHDPEFPGPLVSVSSYIF